MNDIIQLLPDSVANQIAAGEVIQRPASIIKELVENSLDAGATRIQIIVTDAGKTTVQVIDNGKGMSPTDARLSFERHATSKIRSADDLFALTTMGFRGEALASIAAVAQVELRTRREEDELGTQINIEGSRIIGQDIVVCPVGANFIIRNIFFNTPVRRRYLGSDRTELRNIMTEFERIALAHPDISLSLATPQATLLDLPTGSFRQRLVNVFGKNLEKYLLNVEVETSVVRIVGYVGTPESSKKKGAQQYLFVNGRFMKHIVFAKAIMTAYERLIPDGDQVPFFLQLFVDPGRIDVNIHPTKTEIKFEDSHTIFQILQSAVREALGKFNAIPTIDFDTEQRPEIPIFTTEPTHVEPPRINVDPSFNPFDTSSVKACGTTTRKASASPNPPHPSRNYRQQQADYEFINSPFESAQTPTQPSAADDVNQKFCEPSQEGKIKDLIPDWDPISSEYLQYRGRYLVTAISPGLLIIDAVRAHVRVLYEQYITRDTLQSAESQGLLFAHVIELPPQQSALLQTMTDDVELLGFNISHLGGGTFSILGVPSSIGAADPVETLRNIVEDALDDSNATLQSRQSRIALSLARRSAIPVGQVLSQEEMRKLVSDLFKTSNPNYTPDGKSILTILPDEAITDRFK